MNFRPRLARDFAQNAPSILGRALRRPYASSRAPWKSHVGLPEMTDEKPGPLIAGNWKMNGLRAQGLAWSYSTVWRVADRAGIELTAGREAKGYKRLPPERRAKVIEARRANPDAPQEHDCAVGWCQPVHSLADRTRSS
jgi:hypothetical protein